MSTLAKPKYTAPVIFAQLAAVAVTILCMDGVYLNALPFRKVLSEVQGGAEVRINPVSAAACYVLLTCAVVYFANVSGLVTAAVAGLVAYGVYELTNHATLTAWPLWMVVVDTVWGGLIFLAGAAVALGVRGLLLPGKPTG